MTKFRTSYNYKPELGLVNDEASCTVPDQSMSVQEILHRFASGRPLRVNNNLVFTGDDYTPDVKTMDITEVEELKAATAERISSLDKSYKEQSAKARERHLKRKQERFGRQMDIEDVLDQDMKEKPDMKADKGRSAADDAKA